MRLIRGWREGRVRVSAGEARPGRAAPTTRQIKAAVREIQLVSRQAKLQKMAEQRHKMVVAMSRITESRRERCDELPAALLE